MVYLPIGDPEVVDSYRASFMMWQNQLMLPPLRYMGYCMAMLIPLSYTGYDTQNVRRLVKIFFIIYIYIQVVTALQIGYTKTIHLVLVLTRMLMFHLLASLFIPNLVAQSVCWTIMNADINPTRENILIFLATGVISILMDEYNIPIHCELFDVHTVMYSCDASFYILTNLMLPYMIEVTMTSSFRPPFIITITFLVLLQPQVDSFIFEIVDDLIWIIGSKEIVNDKLWQTTRIPTLTSVLNGTIPGIFTIVGKKNAEII